MTEHEALIQAILDDPEDDALRLIYADWLEERGDRWAGVIRMQCEMARWPDGHPKQGDLHKRTTDLMQSLREDEPVQRLYELLMPANPMPVFELNFDRGLFRIPMPAERLLAAGAELVQAVPRVQLELSWIGDHLVELCSAPWLDRVVRLDADRRLYENFPEFLAARLLTCLPRLNALWMSGGGDWDGLDDWVASRLAQAPLLRQIRHLTLSWNRLGAAGVRALVQSPHVRRLRHLDLSGHYLGDDGVNAVAASAHLGSLCHLDLSHNRCTPVGVRMLATSTGLPSLKWLGLQDPDSLPSFSDDTREAVRLLVESPTLGRLETVWLSEYGSDSSGPPIVEWLQGRSRQVALNIAFAHGPSWY